MMAAFWQYLKGGLEVAGRFALPAIILFRKLV
jgi:hypothetical protein